MKKIVIVVKKIENSETLIRLLNTLFPECDIHVILLDMEANVSSPKGIISGVHMVDAVNSSKMGGECLPVANEKVLGQEFCDRTRGFLARVKGANKRILVVDDEESIRSVVSHLLSIMGYETVSAGSGTEALKLFLSTSFDLVVTDLQMPGMDGWALAARIKDTLPNIPVVLLTAQAEEDIQEKLKERSVDHVIFKPFTLEDIEKAMQRIWGP